MKIISKRNPIVFLDNIFKNVESVPTTNYFIVDTITGILYDRVPELIETEIILPSLIELDLMYDAENDNIRLKTEQEILDYTNNIIDISFHKKKIKLLAPNYKFLIDNGFGNTAIVIKENIGVIKEFVTLEDGIVEGSFYLDFINLDDELMIDDAVSAGILIKTINETR